jgi:DNA polymerase III alpha subunit
LVRFILQRNILFRNRFYALPPSTRGSMCYSLDWRWIFSKEKGDECELHLHVGEHVLSIGWLVTGKTVQTKDGDPMKFVSFEDTTGIYETVFFPKV